MEILRLNKTNAEVERESHVRVEVEVGRNVEMF